MAHVLRVKDEGVTTGVYDKDLVANHDLVEVTFADDFGNVRTVFAHKDGPFGDADSIMHAAIDGTLHTEVEHPEGYDEPKHPAGPVFN